MAGGRAAQGEPSLLLAAGCCLRPHALQGPLSLSPEGLFLHLSLTSPETFLCHSSLLYGCSFSFLFTFACSPFARVGNTFFLLKQTYSPRKFPKKQQLLYVMTHVINVMAHDSFWSGMDGSQSWQSRVDTQMEAFDEKTGFRLAIRIPRQISERPPTDFTDHHCECIWCGPTPEK